MGLQKSLNEYGFENVPQSLLDEIASWKNDLRNAPTQYFEGKPERTVGLGEFAGAIVPENTPQNLIDMLGRYGVDVQKYTDDAQRTALRDKYSSEMFVRPETAITAGLLGAGALTGSNEAEAAIPEGVLPMAVHAAGQSSMEAQPDYGRDFGTIAGLIDMLLPLVAESVKPAMLGNAELTDEQRRRGYYNQGVR